ncbi:PucR family transcriptional regulator [Streptomyces sp. NPDC056222]|uniref:PucR family transcriptional regulator n=1 Tax=Streptomyces sp. NPDC056222 TaxID=3345749 RepID=UPI0035D57BF6
MHVGHLLQLDSLRLALVWGDEGLLGHEISGVTATDLEDPTRFLQPGEIVLSGLVWWNPDDSRARTDRFVAALRSAGAAALLAGEETHGTVPADLVAACEAHRIPLLAVPSQTTFRAVTEAVYLRQWGDLSRRPTLHHALPENVRNDLSRVLERGPTPAELLDRAFAHLGTPPCHLLTSSGRTVARTASAPELTAHQAASSLHDTTGTTLRAGTGGTPFDAWHLYLPAEATTPPRVLHEIAEVMAQYRDHHDRRRRAEREAADALVGLIDTPAPDATAVDGALRACGLPSRDTRYRVVVASMDDADGSATAADALTEALSHLAPVFAVGTAPGGEAIGVLEATADDGTSSRLADIWPLLAGCHPQGATALRAGFSAPVPHADGLRRALEQARYASAAARSGGAGEARVRGVEELDTVEALLAGVPADVKAVYSTKTLGPLLDGAGASHRVLLETLEVFLGLNCSWARTAETLNLHVNTVHYRIQRIEALTGRDLSRLDHKLDLRAALLCR